MIEVAKYEVKLSLNGLLVGDIRELAENLTWKRCRTKIGVDSISFTLNDTKLAKWCEERGTMIVDLLKPLALDCQLVRDGTPIVGGYLATMPSYQPKGNNASLALKFDGYINYLANVHLPPGTTMTGKMGDVVKTWVEIAEARSIAAGKGFGFKPGAISDMALVTSTFENYKDIKGAIADRCDNVSGAGPFEFYVHPDRTFDVIKSSDFGEEITDYIIEYPTIINAVSATSISAKEVSGFASTIIGIGSGEVSGDESEDTAITVSQTNSSAVEEYGYAEKILQNSSVSTLEVLERNVATALSASSSLQWQPELKLSGRTVSPTPSGGYKIWIGDTITVQNNQDRTGMTSGKFRVNSLQVSVKSTGAEEITPSLSRSEAINTSSFANEWVRMQNELLNLKTAKRP